MVADGSNSPRPRSTSALCGRRFESRRIPKRRLSASISGAPIVVELTFSYASWVVRDCPGYWWLKGGADTGMLVWSEGSLAPEDAIYADLLNHVETMAHGQS